jgi:hypothetical protein
MITKTEFSVDISLIDLALDSIPSDNLKFSINEPTGRFFYDPWQLKDELKGSVWEKLYNSLPKNLGETRIICLEGGKLYSSHADIDDRYHLNLSGNSCYLADLDNAEIYPTIRDGIWYEMDAGVRHSAINFSNRYRYQVVARKLLNSVELKDKRSVKIRYSNIDPDDARYYFDDAISPWLNRANKRSVINNFEYSNSAVSFEIEEHELKNLKSLLNEYFMVEVK